MTFHWPHAFWLLLIPLAMLARDLRRRRAATASFPKITTAEIRHSSLVVDNSPSPRGGSVRTRWFLYVALAAATAALARPQWGRLEEPVFDQAREIVIALDLSRSMLAEDVKPNRLERSRLLITSLLERLKGERVGLVVFSGTAFLQSPLSSDYEILREFLPVLDPGYLPEGGTNYDDLLKTTVEAFGDSGAADRFLVVLSDGEAQSETWKKHLGDLKTKGIRVLGLGIGTEGGSIIPDGQGSFVKDERGAVVLSKLNGATLRELADATDGRYVDASGWVDLAQLVQDTVEQGRKGEFKETSRIRLAERFQWPLAAAFAFFLLSFWREAPVRPKPRQIRLTTRTAALAASGLLSSVFSPPSSVAAEGEAPAASAPLTQLVTRLASRDDPGARDYADLARATVTFGQRTQAAQQPVPESVVRDGLAAVAAGSALDAKAADWPALKEQLEALLPPKEQPKQDPPKQDQKQPEQNKSEQSKDEKKDGQNGQSSDQKKDESKQDPSKSDQQKSDSGKPQDPQSAGGSSSPGADLFNGEQPPPSEKKSDKPGQSAFGDMKKDPPPASEGKSELARDSEPQPAEPPSDEMQQVGGAPSEASTDPARQDPALAIPLQKLDQVKQGDSPARLFQLLQEPGKSSEPAPKGKDW